MWLHQITLIMHMPMPSIRLSELCRVCVDCVVCAESYMLQVIVLLSVQVEMLEEIVSQKGACTCTMYAWKCPVLCA